MDATRNGRALPGRYLSFTLAEETYAIPIETVAEINAITAITAVPHAAPFVKGVLNLRGTVIPIIDLRLKFNFPPKDYTKETCIIVTESAASKIGIIVDTVKEVVDFGENEIEDVPVLGNQLKTKFLLGMGKKDKKVVILISIGEVLSREEMSLLGHSVQSVLPAA